VTTFHYFACKWVIQPLTSTNLQEIRTILSNLDGKGDISIKGVYDEEEVKIGIWFLKLSTKEGLQLFVDKIGNNLGLAEWYLTSEEEYLTGMSLNSPNNLPHLVDTTRAFGDFNREILDSRDT